MRYRLLALLAATSLSLVACGSSGGDDVDSATTTTTSADPDGSTSEQTDDTGTDDTGTDDTGTGTDDTVDGGEGGDVDLDSLEAVMPDADQVGDGFEVTEDDDGADSDDDEDTASDRAVEEACPAAAEYFEDVDDNADEADQLKRTYEHADTRQVEITLDPTGSDQRALADIDRTAELFNSCGEIEYEERGTTTRMTIRAEVDEETVTKGLVLDIHFVVASPSLTAPLDVKLKGMLFLVDDVSVSVMMIDGLDEETMEPIESDFDRLYDLAALMEREVSEVVGG